MSEPLTKSQIIADIIEPGLSGQYGRDVAEDIAKEILDALALKEPIKWRQGRKDGDKIDWSDWFVFADTEEAALKLALEKDGIAKSAPYFAHIEIIVRPWVDGDTE